MAIKKLLPVMAAAVALLSGCGGSSSDTSSTGSTRYIVNNTQTTNISTVAYVSDSNEELLRKSFDCPAQTKCDLWASADKPGTMLFYDKDGVLISSFIFAQKPTEIEFVKTTNRMMGLYVFDLLKQTYAISPQTLSFRLNNFFANYESQDGLADKLEELGIYYQVKVVKNGMSLNSFLSELNTRLINGEVLPAGYSIASNLQPWYAFLQKYLGLELFSNAYAQEVVPNCPAGLTTAFDIGSEILGELVPIPLLGSVMQKAFDMATESCDGSNDQLGNMEVALAEIQATLKLQKKSLTVILEALTDINVKNKFLEIDDLDTVLQGFVSKYVTLVDGVRYKSLQEFVKAQGGFEKAYSTSANFKGLVDSSQASGLPYYWETLKKVGSVARKDSIKTALDAKCSKGTETSANDIVATRMDCNLAALEYNTRVAGIVANHMLVLKDITQTIAYYAQTEQSFIDRNVSKFDQSRDTWANQFDAVIKPIAFAALDEVKKGFSGDAQFKGYYRTIAGLDASAGYALEQRLKDLSCTVTKWYVSDPPYIEASCPDPEGTGELYISRVYYKQDQDLVNFSGVLVPRDRLNKSYDRLTNLGFTQGYAYSIDLGISNAGNTQELSYNLIMNLPNKTSSVFSLQQDYSSGLRFIANTAGTVGRTANVEKALGFDFDRVTSYTSSNAKLYKVGVRYVDKSNKDAPDKAYAWQVLLDGRLSFVHNYLYGKMLCISSNCSINGYRLNFADGPQNVWFGMVADGKSSTDSETSVYYEINGTLMK